MPGGSERPAIVDFAERQVAAAGRFLAARHRAPRAVESLLSSRFEEPAAAQAEVAALLERPCTSGAAAIAGGEVVGPLLGSPRPDAVWGCNIWVEAGGHAVRKAELARDLYAHAARWVDEGCTAHYAVVPASDQPLVDAWFRLGFGQQHVHGIRDAPAAAPVEPPGGVVLRRAARAELDAFAELDLLLPEHQGRSPVFASGAPPILQEARAEWEESLADPESAAFAAEQDGRCPPISALQIERL